MKSLELGGIKYEIKEQLSKQGCQGTVFKGIDTQTAEEVIIKQQDDVTNSEKQILKALKEKNQNNIISIKGYQTLENGQVTVIMEKGKYDLEKFLTKHYMSLSKQQLLSIFLQIVKAVKQFHDLGYFHRDLKPANFIINNNQIVKLIDFGTSKLDESIEMTVAIGTKCYSAPETMWNQYDKSVDIWSLGCILYELLVNEPFFERKIKFEQEFINKKIDKSIKLGNNEKYLIKQLLQVEPSQRLSVEQIVNELQLLNVKEELNWMKTVKNLSFENQDSGNKIEVEGKQYILSPSSRGSVYKGKSLQSQEEVAIMIKKSIPFNLLVVLQNQQKNPKQHIIEIKGIARETFQKVIIIMELADQNLQQFIKFNPQYRTLNKQQKNQIFNMLVMAVKEFHELKYFHRNITPEDFVVFQQDKQEVVRIKLANFRTCNEQFKVSNYSAPEILDGKKFNDTSADAWALGCILFEILKGDTFFQSNSQEDLFKQINYLSQCDIDRKIQQVQQLNENEKFLISKLIQMTPNQRLTINELIKYLENQENIKNQTHQYQLNQIRPINGKVEEYQQYQIQYQPQFQQNLQFQKFKTQYQMERELREEKEKEKEIEEIKRIVGEQQQLKNMVFKREQEQQLKIKLKEMEEELKRKNEDAQKKQMQEKVKIEQLNIEQELQYQMEQIRKQQKEETQQKQKEFVERLQKEEEEKTKRFLMQIEQETQQRITQEMHQQYLLQEKKRKEELEKQQQLIEIKNKASRTIKSIKELTEKFIQNLEEKQSQSTQSGFLNNNLYSEYARLIQNYIEKFKNQLESVRQDENRLQNIDQYLDINVAQEIEEKYSEELAKILFEQSNVQNEITKKLKQVEEQQAMKEQIEQQSNLLKQQLLETKLQYQNANIQIENKLREFNQNFNDIEQKILLLQEERYQQNFNNINSQYDFIIKSISQVQNISMNKAQYQDCSVEIYQTSQFTYQLIKYNEELGLLTQQKVELVKELENFNQELKNKTSVQLQQFEVEALKYDQKLKQYQSQNIQNQLLIQKMQQVNYQYNNEIQNLQNILKTNSILQRLEILKLTNLLNQYLTDLENYDIQLINYFEEQNKIVRYQELLSRLSEDEKSKQLQSFLLKMGQLKEVIKELGFNQNFEIYNLIIKYKQQNEEKLEQLKQYVKQCFKCFKQNQDLYHQLKKNIQAKKEFQSQRIEISRNLDQLYNLSQEKINQLENLQMSISEQQKKIKFEGSQEEYQEVYEYWKKSQEIQLVLEKLHEKALDSLQRSQTDPNYSFQDFISKQEQELGKIKQELQAIKKNQIKKFNESLKQNFESLVLQIYVITIFSIYKTNEYYIRKVRSSQSVEEKRKSLEELDKEKEKQAILKAQFKKYLDDIDGIQFWKSSFQELIEEQNQIEERQQRLLSEINTRSRVKLRAQIKNQQMIKEIIELEEFQELSNVIIFNKKIIQL